LCALVYFRSKGLSRFVCETSSSPGIVACCPFSHTCSADDTSEAALKGIVLLDSAATVKRTKNIRDGYMYCIRIDTPNAGGLQFPGVKRWPKLVMALRSEPDMQSWITAIRCGIEGGQVQVVNRRLAFDVSQRRSENMVVFQGSALMEVRQRCILFILQRDAAQAHSLGFSMIDCTSMKLRHFVLKIVVRAPHFSSHLFTQSSESFARSYIQSQDGLLVLFYYKGAGKPHLAVH
jgi:hypothetical protein